MRKEKNQIFYIHGGMTFKNNVDYLKFLKTRKIKIEERIKWSDKYLRNKLDKEFQIIKPRMPLQDNSKYEEWKIHFERHFPYLRDNIILIGSSLGGIFLAKYFSQKITKINYTALSITTLVFLLIIIFFISGFLGLIVLIASTLTGIYCISLGVRRTNMMGCLLLPTILLYLL